MTHAFKPLAGAWVIAALGVAALPSLAQTPPGASQPSAPGAAVASASPASPASAAPQAASPAPVVAPTARTFAIPAYQVRGDNPLSEQATAAVLAPFVVPAGSLEVLQQATAALEAAFKTAGYPLHRVSLPGQALGGPVQLEVVKFVVGRVTVEGAQHFSAANIRASLPELSEGQAPNFTRLAVQTALANENPSKNVQVKLKESDEADKIDVTLLTRDATPVVLAASLSNAGSDSTGRDRLALVASHSNVAGLDHQFSAAYTTSVERRSDVKQLGLSYRVPFYGAGGALTLSHTRSDVIGQFGAFSSTGAGATLGVDWAQQLAPQGPRRSWWHVGWDLKRFDALQINAQPVPGQMQRASNPLTLGYGARVEGDTSLFNYALDLAVNLGAGSGNDLSSYQSEDPRVLDRAWRALRGNVNWLGLLSGGWTMGVRGAWQYSPQPLIAGEQFGLGGAGSVRGAAERPISGDSGWQATLEFTSPAWVQGLNALAFVDAGGLSNHASPLNPNKPGSDGLASVGLGLRYSQGALGVNLDWGRIVRGSVLPSAPGAALPQAGDDRLHVSLTARF